MEAVQKIEASVRRDLLLSELSSWQDLAPERDAIKKTFIFANFQVGKYRQFFQQKF